MGVSVSDYSVSEKVVPDLWEFGGSPGLYDFCGTPSKIMVQSKLRQTRDPGRPVSIEKLLGFNKLLVLRQSYYDVSRVIPDLRNPSPPSMALRRPRPRSPPFERTRV